MTTIDLNCDMGELKVGQVRNFDAEIMPYISSCNIACGFHSGSPLLIEQTIQCAIIHGVKIGAHPSYNDWENFGRQTLVVKRAVLLAELRYQIAALKGMVESLGQQLYHVKAHGALYNDLLKDDALAEDFVLLVKTIDPQLRILSLAHSNVIDYCEKHGMRYLREGFADRRYETQTALLSRAFTDAVLHQPKDVLQQIDGFLGGKVELVNGQQESIKVDSICLHSDTSGAVALSKTIHQYLTDQAIQIQAIA
ncbi:MAG: 5-oxoprolinase subunit PxpA [Bacteroidota bacterium]